MNNQSNNNSDSSEIIKSDNNLFIKSEGTNSNKDFNEYKLDNSDTDCYVVYSNSPKNKKKHSKKHSNSSYSSHSNSNSSSICNNKIYGSFYSITKQTIKTNKNIILEKCNNSSNIYFDKKQKYIKINICGIYIIHFTCQIQGTGQIALYINEHITKNTITTNNDLIIIHDIVKLNKGDKVSFRNIYDNDMETSLPISGMLPESQNVYLTIYPISIYNY
jgi:hypothetical protein